MEVHKFGGSCFRDRAGLEQVLEQIRFHDELVITVSAAFGITKLLQQSFMITHEREVDALLSTLRERHIHFIDDASILDATLARLHRIYLGAIFAKGFTAPVRDLILSFGERLMALVLNAHLTSSHILYPEQFLRLDPNLNFIEIQRSRELLPPRQASYTIVPGFYACDDTGKVKTLGRSGTDYTGAALAVLYKADSYTIWKDVDGFMSADPHVVPSAHLIEQLSYAEAEELAYFGASVLHEKTIQLLQMASIPLFIKNINNPSPYSTITDTVQLGIKSISAREVYLLQFPIPAQLTQQQTLTLLLEELDQQKEEILTLTSTFTSIECCVTRHIESTLAHLSMKRILIAIVGESSIDQHLQGKVLHTLKDYTITHIFSGSKKHILYLLVDPDTQFSIIQRLHQALFR
ncbi:MAG: hypothetical protein INQ03_09790 [Candidatus Heimdallarchaeota archaeon]|nr:hypothetical protein [Candidatus Heimdallarchaeota archaeon]